MKSLPFLLSAVLLMAGLNGCNRSAAETGATHAAAALAAQYKAGHGLQLTPAAARFIGLATAEVGAQEIGDAGSVTAIPAAALLRTVKGDFVFVANGDWYLRTPVQIGAAHGNWLEVTGGLYEGDTVVTQGASALWLAELSATNGGVGCADGH
jgi:multidrug efflux pump subunit AcrA (membrane-fusion protein)